MIANSGRRILLKKHGSMFEKQERKIIVFRLVQPSDMHFT